MTTTGIVLALALGSIVFFSTIFLVILVMMRNRWQRLGDPHPKERPQNQHDA